MNLVQMRERLKDVPTQAIMAYANGMNEEVPPFLALMELNRRNRMEQEAATGEPPEGTVKDQIEAKAMGMQQMAGQQMPAAMQQQMMQGMPQQGIAAMRPPMGMPQGMPMGMPQGMARPMPPQMMQRPPQMAMGQQPVRMAGGGVATLNVPDDVTMYGSGGIVAFADGELVEDVYAQNIPGMQEYIDKKIAEGEAKKQREEQDRREFLERAGAGRVSTAPTAPASNVRDKAWEGRSGSETAFDEAIATLEEERRQDIARGDMEAAAGKEREIADMQARKQGRMPTRVAGQPSSMAPPQMAQAAPQGIAQVAPQMAPQAAPQMAQPAQPDVMKQIQQIFQPAAQPGQPAQPTMTDMLRTQATAKPPTIQDLQAQRAEAAKTMPYLDKQPGAELEKYLAQMAGRAGEERTRFEEMEKDRTRAALWKSLMAAGEASRGQRGIGALMGGFGKTAAAELEAGRGREAEFAKTERERDLAIVKMKQEIENARIAQANGDYKGYQEAIEKAKDLQRKATEKGAELEQRDREAMQRAQADALIRNMPGQEQQMFKQFADSWLAKPENRGKNLSDAFMAYKGAGTAMRGQMTWDQALDNARQEIKDPTMWQAMENAAAKREGRQPRKIEQAIMERAQQLMQGAQGIGALPQQTGGPREGQEATSSSGKPIVYRNGRWEYK